ncbi:cell division protein FtsA [Ereboglobus sp. PH5-5]|uniref:cell division protein FtsA n=1 Tax=Ereboglobus sp. PH5-5 TaxID=2940529 RepID=UPI00240606A5|nr:cell division protein FtsA [Ereboglobus sp. PH5-5]MDF9833234.1 cell division protein FtsA [Ereboglobus sp. PH5-5]
MAKNFKIIAGVEIGTSKITVLVGELTSRNLTIIGKSECQSAGVMKGVIIDAKAASNAVHTALEGAEKSAHIPIDEVILAQTGMHLQGFKTDAIVNVSSASNTVSSTDIQTACQIALSKQLPDNRTIVHEIRRPFRLDGQIIANPLNIRGNRLEANYWIVHGDTNTVTNSIYIIQGYNLPILDLGLASLASGSMITTPEDRHHGVLAIDIGAGTTDYVLYRNGAPHVTGVVPVGGNHVTNDLMLGLRTTPGQAETIKIRHGRATLHCRDKTTKVWLNGDHGIGDRPIPLQSIEQIIAARISEIFEIVRKKLDIDYTPENTPAGIVLTGGTSKLEGIVDAASKAFESTARLGEFPPHILEQLRAPGYATALGLLFTGASAARGQLPPKKGGIWGLFNR